MMEGLTSWVARSSWISWSIDGKARGKGEGSGSEHTPREEHDEHTQNSHDTRQIAPERHQRSDRILARKDRSTCSLKSTSEREEHLGEGLDNLETRHGTPRPCSTMDA